MRLIYDLARPYCGPDVVRRSDLSTKEQLAQIAIPSVNWDRNPRLDANYLVYGVSPAGVAR